eukprot:747545-Hanusia_phi.AAC.1
MGGTMSAGLYEIELYGGLFMFMAYVIFDTQMIIEDAYANRKDFVAHAMELLIGSWSFLQETQRRREKMRGARRVDN